MREITEAISQTIAYVRVAERLNAAISTFGPVTAAIASVFELESDLAPELHAATGSCVEALDALKRAHDFALARAEVNHEILFGPTPTKEELDDDDPAR